jgi:hypothetical protein
MTDLLIDFSSARPNPAAIRASGYSGVIVYLTPAESWSISNDPDYITACLAAGLSVRFVYEVANNAFLNGTSQGSTDGRTAASLLAKIPGVPGNVGVYYAGGDFAIPNGEIPMAAAYLAAAAVTSGRVASPYAPGNAIKTLGKGWQNAEDAGGWSGSVASPKANIYQRVAHTLPLIAGSKASDYDEDVLILEDGLAWTPTTTISAPSAPTTPVTAPPSSKVSMPASTAPTTPTSTSQETDMLYFPCADPVTGGLWVAYPDGHVDAFDGAPYLGGLNNHPAWNAGTATDPCQGIAVWGTGDAPATTGYYLIATDSENALPGIYRMPRSGVYAS